MASRLQPATQERVPPLRGSGSFPTLPSTPPSAPCWAKLFRPFGTSWSLIFPLAETARANNLPGCPLPRPRSRQALVRCLCGQGGQTATLYATLPAQSTHKRRGGPSLRVILSGVRPVAVAIRPNAVEGPLCGKGLPTRAARNNADYSTLGVPRLLGRPVARDALVAPSKIMLARQPGSGV